MKFFVAIAMFFALTLFNVNNDISTVCLAQDEEELEDWEKEDYSGDEVDEDLKYYKEKYEMTFNEPFEDVWNAVLQAIKDTDCMIATNRKRQTDEGFFRGVIKSDFCVFSTGKDSTFDVLGKYSYDMPVIAGGIWLSGRIQHKFIITEQEDGSIKVMHTSEMSGWEELITHEVHFWKSNGKIEHFLHEDIKSILAKKK